MHETMDIQFWEDLKSGRFVSMVKEKETIRDCRCSGEENAALTRAPRHFRGATAETTSAQATKRTQDYMSTMRILTKTPRHG